MVCPSGEKDGDPDFDVPREHVLQDERPFFFGANEIGETITLGRPRHPRHDVGPFAAVDDVIEPHVLVEAARQVPHDRSVLGRNKDDVDLAIFAIDRDGSDEVAGR